MQYQTFTYWYKYRNWYERLFILLLRKLMHTFPLILRFFIINICPLGSLYIIQIELYLKCQTVWVAQKISICTQAKVTFMAL